MILFTSGSEKDPKAVQLTHRNIGSNVMDIAKVLTVTSDDIMLANLPLFHVFGHNVDFWLPLLFGMTIVSYANPLEYKKVCTIVREEKVSLMVGTPSFFSGYLRQSDPGDFSSLRVAVAGADKTPDSLRAGFLEKHNLELCEGYGTTETSPVVSTNLPDANKPGSIGKVLPSVRVKIVDINSGEALPPGSEGKILVKGDLVMKGYFDDLEETSLRIKDGWYETGDMGAHGRGGLPVAPRPAEALRQDRRRNGLAGQGRERPAGAAARGRRLLRGRGPRFAQRGQDRRRPDPGGQREKAAQGHGRGTARPSPCPSSSWCWASFPRWAAARSISAPSPKWSASSCRGIPEPFAG